MHIDAPLILFSVTLLLYLLFSERLKDLLITAPMAFLAMGMALHASSILRIDVAHEFIHIFMEVTVIVILFADSSRLNFVQLMRERSLPLRLLCIAMPLSIGVGGPVAQAVFQFDNIFLAFLLAAILAPTDAALGQAVLSGKNVPERLKHALNVESGLNDGVSLPFVLAFLALSQGHENTDAVSLASFSKWMLKAGGEIAMGVFIGVAAAYLLGKIIAFCGRKGWMLPKFSSLAALAIGFIAYGCAESLGGNGFIATFSAGIAAGNATQKHCAALHEFVEKEGQLLTLAVFLLTGLAVLPHVNLTGIHRDAIYAALSLTLVRMVPVAISVIGKKLSLKDTLFLGWFGPRGITSILFAFLIIDMTRAKETDTLYSAALVAVCASIFIHGITAGLCARR